MKNFCEHLPFGPNLEGDGRIEFGAHVLSSLPCLNTCSFEQIVLCDDPEGERTEGREYESPDITLFKLSKSAEQQ